MQPPPSLPLTNYGHPIGFVPFAFFSRKLKKKKKNGFLRRNKKTEIQSAQNYVLIFSLFC